MNRQNTHRRQWTTLGRGALMMALPLITACPKDSPSPTNTPSTEVTDPGLQPADIEGAWASNTCEAYPDGQGGTSYLTRAFDFTPSRWELQLDVFGDADCSFPLFSALIEGPYRLDGPSPTVDEATLGQFAFASNVWTAHQPDLAAVFDASGCGDEAWVVGEPQSVQTTGCIGIAHPAADCPDGEYDLVGKIDGVLYLGERITDMCVEEGRPAALGSFGLAAE